MAKSRSARAYRGHVFTTKKFRPYALGIGQANLAWNDLIEMLGHLFWVLTGDDSDLPMKVWQSSKSDRAKRDMLEAVNRHNRRRKKSQMIHAMEDIDWILKRTNSLEEDRNNLIHSPLSSPNPYSDAVYADWGFGHHRASKLRNKDFLKECRRVRNTAQMLRDFTLDLLAQIRDPNFESWPRRPRLPDHAGSTIQPRRRLTS